jgi:hypothetical protein
MGQRAPIARIRERLDTGADRKNPRICRDFLDGRGWVRTSDLSRVRRSPSPCKFGLFAGKNRCREAPPSAAVRRRLQGIHRGLGQRTAALAQRARLANDSVASRIPAAGGANLCQSDPRVDISVTAMIRTGLIATPTSDVGISLIPVLAGCPVPPPQGSRERDVRSQRPCPLRRRRCRGRRSRRGPKRRGTTRGGSRRPTAASCRRWPRGRLRQPERCRSGRGGPARPLNPTSDAASTFNR